MVVVEIGEGALPAAASACPMPRYGETVEGVIAAIEALAADVAGGLDRSRLHAAGAAGRRPQRRSTARCGTWRPSAPDRPAWTLAGLPAPKPVVTAYTI